MFQAVLHIQTKKHKYKIDLNRLIYITFSIITFILFFYTAFIDTPLHPEKYLTTWR